MSKLTDRRVATKRCGEGFRVRGILLGGLACLTALLVVGCSGGIAQEETEASTQPSATSEEAATASADQPNMIFVLTDDLDYAST